MVAYSQGVIEVRVPLKRWPRWRENFAARHGQTEWRVGDGALHGIAADGAEVIARLPFSRAYDGPADPDGFTALALPPQTWGVLLVRKGGFAIGALEQDRVTASKVGQRHVQGRTKAGGQSQQRFARRRDNQARDAYQAAADHACRVWGWTGSTPVSRAVVVGGDRQAVAEVLGDPRLASVQTVGWWLAVGDPRRDVLVAAVAEAQTLSLQISEQENTG